MVIESLICPYDAESAFDFFNIFFGHEYFDRLGIDGLTTIRAWILKHILLVVRVESDVG